MPIYEYYCGNCNERYEVIQKVGASLSIKCESCDGLAERVMSKFSTKIVPTRSPERSGKTVSLAEQLRPSYKVVEPK